MAHIGIISENANNDGKAIADLLERYFPEQATYQPILEKYIGSQVGNKSFLRDLKELQDDEYFDCIIVVKDLDNDDKEAEIKKIFEDCADRIVNKNINLKFRYMIEALALADWKNVCKYYKKNPKKINLNLNARNAKDELRNAFGYEESHLRNLVFCFDKETLIQRYAIWAAFINEFNDVLTSDW